MNSQLAATEPSPKLYYIDGYDEGGESLSWFVRARSPLEAYMYWHEYQDDDASEIPFEDDLKYDCDQCDEDTLRIFEVPLDGPLGLLSWHKDEVKVVAYAERRN